MAEEQIPDTAAPAKKVTLKVMTLPESVTVSDLAERVQVDSVQMVKQLMRIGIFANVTQVIDFNTASQAIRPFGYSAHKATEPPKNLHADIAEGKTEGASARPPVVTILGHVDHGKTTLLDAIRQTNVVDNEAGGITQHIAAYQVKYNNQSITFLDTPGHQAFTAMRARGTQVTDIAVLVVAADDGVMPQTIEAINHIKAASVPIIVAINKMDMPDADPERVKRQLSEQELVVEEWGGDVIAVPLSAKQKEGISDLLESIIVVSEMGELVANPERPGVGVVIESRKDKNQGALMTTLIQTGTIRMGDNIVAGTNWGRVKALFNDAGRRIEIAGPSDPIEVLGINGLPMAGDRLTVMPDEKAARDKVSDLLSIAQRSKQQGATLANFLSSTNTGQEKEMNLIVKTDVQGSVDAIRASLEQLSTADTRIKLIHISTGSINESDVLLAVASQAIVIGFNSRPEPGAKRLADQDGIEIRYYNIIYRLTEDIESGLKGLLDPTIEDIVEGTLEVRALFPLGKNRISAGCQVLEGQISRNSLGRVKRGETILYDGPISSLRRFKDDVRQVQSGYECGISLEGFNDYVIGDMIQAHNRQQTNKPS